MKPTLIKKEGHNDLDEGFIDEDESISSNAKVLKTCGSASQDIPELAKSTMQPGRTGPNKGIRSSAGKSFRYAICHYI